ncbi:hypothetical protein [Mycolicibacterium gilvum]|uniref:Uncharacterized protein n=1 Tax=Mycolicibacterium gilvum (strain DSM 45189 / LMG 24558 / Spyr1) TaxID=278137 RepID=E6TH04_MYCSR|nr:hypothetical protein [Mycolicibacterium gilvum]ADT97884.1 hypothetical protein Mspyr1_12030 [Mycolicibacterium gilvum Spyr1]
MNIDDRPDQEIHDRSWAARARLAYDRDASAPVDQHKVTDALLSCGCQECRSQVRRIAVEFHRLGLLG